MKAFQSSLGACNVPLATNECLVILTGGTPEAVVAGIAVGFKQIIYVASDDAEEKMMAVLSISEEREGAVDYMTCPGKLRRSMSYQGMRCACSEVVTIHLVKHVSPVSTDSAGFILFWLSFAVVSGFVVAGTSPRTPWRPTKAS